MMQSSSAMKWKVYSTLFCERDETAATAWVEDPPAASSWGEPLTETPAAGPAFQRDLGNGKARPCILSWQTEPMRKATATVLESSLLGISLMKRVGMERGKGAFCVI